MCFAFHDRHHLFVSSPTCCYQCTRARCHQAAIQAAWSQEWQSQSEWCEPYSWWGNSIQQQAFDWDSFTAWRWNGMVRHGRADEGAFTPWLWGIIYCGFIRKVCRIWRCASRAINIQRAGGGFEEGLSSNSILFLSNFFGYILLLYVWLMWRCAASLNKTIYCKYAPYWCSPYGGTLVGFTDHIQDDMGILVFFPWLFLP